VLIEAPEDAASLVEAGAALAASHEDGQLILCDLAEQEQDLQALADLASSRGAPAVEQSRFGLDIAAKLPGYVAAGKPHAVVLGPCGISHGTLTADGANQLVTVLRSPPDAPAAVAAIPAPGENGEAAVQVARHLAAGYGLNLVISPAGGPGADLAAELASDRIVASAGPPPAGALIVAATESSGDAHLAVRAGTRGATWPDEVRALDEVGS
jgi:hypothetical protein